MGRPGREGMSAAVFLDRDGVISRSDVRDGRPYAPTRVADFEILPGVPDAVASLKHEGFAVIVVTNQPDVTTGKQTRETVSAMHDQLRAAVRVDDIKVCYCTDAENCARRKPLPGMLLEAAREHELDLQSSFMVGDRWRDMEAGAAAGCSTVFIDRGYEEKLPQRYDYRAGDLPDAVEWIISKRKQWEAT